jgi:hypothetical protein
MKKYKVEVCFTAWTVEDVVAESQAKAIEKACANFSAYSCTDAKPDYARSFVAAEEEINEVQSCTQ